MIFLNQIDKWKQTYRFDFKKHHNKEIKTKLVCWSIDDRFALHNIASREGIRPILPIEPCLLK